MACIYLPLLLFPENNMVLITIVVIEKIKRTNSCMDQHHRVICSIPENNTLTTNCDFMEDKNMICARGCANKY